MPRGVDNGGGNPGGLPKGARIMDVFRPKWLEEPGNLEKVQAFAKLGIPIKQSLASIGVPAARYERWLEKARSKRKYHQEHGQVKADIDWVYLAFLLCHEEGRGASERAWLEDLEEWHKGVTCEKRTIKRDGDGNVIEDTTTYDTKRSESATKWLLANVHSDKYGPNARGESDGDAALNKRVRLVDGDDDGEGSE